MEEALYHPGLGYYSSDAPRTGWRGNYMTSAELDPAFGELWAGGVRDLWLTSGRPAAFEIVEVGPGEGGFARGLLAALPPDLAEVLTYRLVERNPAAETRQRAALARWSGVEWSPSLGEVAPVAAGIVVANEILDNLPVHLVSHRAGKVVELMIGAEKDELTTVPAPVSDPEIARFLEVTGTSPQEEAVLEVGLAAEAFIEEAAGKLGRGGLLFVDYGAESTELSRRFGGTLVCYSAAGTDLLPLDSPGEKDITAHANWTWARAVAESLGLRTIGPRPQAEVLRALGSNDVISALRRDHDVALAAGDGAAALRSLSRRQAVAALLDRSGLGGMDVFLALKDVAPPRWAT